MIHLTKYSALALTILAVAVPTTAGCGGDQSAEQKARDVADRVIEKDNLKPEMKCFREARETANIDKALDKAQDCKDEN